MNLPMYLLTVAYFTTSSLNRTVPSKIWSSLHPTVSQGLLVDRFLPLLIISVLFSPLKTLPIGFHFCVSLLHLTTILTLGSFSKETQCEKQLNISFAFFDSVINICFHNTLFINVSPLSSKPKPRPSFQSPPLTAPVPLNVYIQGSPIHTSNDQYFTIPQVSFVYAACCITFFWLCIKINTLKMWVPQKVLGQCVNSAPVAFLENFKVKCETFLRSCPTGPPLQTLPTDLKIKVKNGQGGMSYSLNTLQQCFSTSETL